ncbi:uncharacterized protein [Coffea arabica]|uniref:Reverse transcriptase Ty1/copia-type domain-containing protein n=1 Tax=Coffea arabica TaxID=13443 RepID=A0ABM4X5I8_COFAR
MFFLTALKVAYILNSNLPKIPAPVESESEEVTKQRQKREEDEIICRGHILNTLSDSYYDNGVEVVESFEVGAIIAKLPPLWNNYQKKLLHTSETLTLSSVLKHLRIEEGVRILQKLEIDNAPKTNMVEEKMNSEIVAMMTFGTVTELHMMTPTPSKDWWYDSSAVIHVCNAKNQFKSYELLEGHEVVMANGVRAKVHGKGDVRLQFTSGEKLVLTNVLHVPDVVKNLVSADILYKKGLKAVLESNNVILSKNGVFVGKGYSCNGMFKLSINKVNDTSIYSLASTSSACSYFLWHGRLGHVNHKVLKFMSKDGLISYNDLENKKCETCVQAKITRKFERLLDLGSNIIVESRDVEFFKDKFFRDSTVNIDPSSPNAISSSGTKRREIDTPSEPRRSQRQRKEKQLPLDFVSFQAIVFLVKGNRDSLLNKTPILLSVEDDPKTYDKATKSRDAAFWKEAVNDEMDLILSNNTWVLVDLPQGSKPIGCKWVFCKKYVTDGTILTYKARLVAKGYRQKEEIDYFDTYTPVARITSVRILLALASVFSLHVHQMDVKTAFLNGDLNKEVDMEQPEGFVLSSNEHMSRVMNICLE